MKFRRKSTESGDWGVEVMAEPDVDDPAEEEAPATGPFDVDDPADEYTRIDLGSLLLPTAEGLELRLQIDEQTEEVRTAILASKEGALELRAFAAPRGGDLWSEVRPKIAADFAQRGGTATERTGSWGPELHCQLTVKTPDGGTGTQASRIIGINGSRWLLRATLLGRAAVDPSQTAHWEELIQRVRVRRGDHAMPVGSELPLQVPPGANPQPDSNG